MRQWQQPQCPGLLTCSSRRAEEPRCNPSVAYRQQACVFRFVVICRQRYQAWIHIHHKRHVCRHSGTCDIEHSCVIASVIVVAMKRSVWREGGMQSTMTASASANDESKCRSASSITSNLTRLKTLLRGSARMPDRRPGVAMTMWGRWASAEAWLIMSIPETVNHDAGPCWACTRSHTASDDEDMDRHSAAKCIVLLRDLKMQALAWASAPEQKRRT
jgi:hypothetical protein